MNELVQNVLDSKQKIKLLGWLVERPYSFSISELSRDCDLPKATVSTIIRDWTKTGIVIIRYQGRNKLAELNKKFYLFPEIKKIFWKSKNFQKPIMDELEKMRSLKSKEIKAIIAFGSRMRKDFTYYSDLDVLIVIEDKESIITEKIMEDAVKASEKTGINFSPTLMSKKDFQTRQKEKDKFLHNILAEGKILKGEKWLEHIQTSR